MSSPRGKLAVAGILFAMNPWPSHASAEPCPGECEVTVGSSHVRVDVGGGSELEDFFTNVREGGPVEDGVSQVPNATYELLEAGGYVDMTSNSTPTQDPATGRIVASFVETGALPRFGYSTVFQLNEIVTEGMVDATLDKTFIVEYLLNEGSLELDLLVLTDFELNGDAIDDVANFLPPELMEQLDGDTLGTVGVTGDSPFPDTWQILLEPTDTGPRPCTDLTNMGSGTGPGDLRRALCWQINLARGDRFELGLRTRVMPEPGQLLMLASGIAFLAVVGRRRIQ